MDSTELVGGIYDFFAQFVPLFKVFWTVTVFIGAALLVLAFILKKNPERKKLPWIVGVIGLLMLVSSGTQLLFSLI